MSGLKLLLLGLFTVLCVGCSELGQMGSEVTPPTLIEKTALPSPPPNINSSDFNLQMELLVSKEGKVLYVHLQNSTGDPEWDSVAAKAILQWKYSPAISNGKPVQLKISQLAHVVPTPPLMMNLSEILCSSLADADSAYAALQGGEKFETVADKYSVPSSEEKSGSLGPVDIHRYGDEIQAELRKLEPGEYTHPIQFGRDYAIYKRASAENM